MNYITLSNCCVRSTVENIIIISVNLILHLKMAQWSNFLLQLIAIGCVGLGVLYFRNVKIKFHGLTMLVAVALNALSIIFIMLPSAIRILSGARVNSFTLMVALHSILGMIAEIVGIYILWNWRFRKPGESCFKFRTQMKRVNLIWFGMFIIGIFIFYQLYF
ncbi:MAG: hypothetical protein ACXAEX_14860 [Promethearchaeota archaeon]